MLDWWGPKVHFGVLSGTAAGDGAVGEAGRQEGAAAVEEVRHSEEEGSVEEVVDLGNDLLLVDVVILEVVLYY